MACLLYTSVRQFVPGADDWQLWKLENGYLAEIGETPLDERKQAQLLQAIQEERITFFAAYRKTRMVGMCSVSRVFSTFACADIGVFEDFFVEPVFRKQGAARQLDVYKRQVLSMANGGEFNFMSILTGVAVPALYIYGAVLNSKTEDEFAA